MATDLLVRIRNGSIRFPLNPWAYWTTIREIFHRVTNRSTMTSVPSNEWSNHKTPEGDLKPAVLFYFWCCFSLSKNTFARIKTTLICLPGCRWAGSCAEAKFYGLRHMPGLHLHLGCWRLCNHTGTEKLGSKKHIVKMYDDDDDDEDDEDADAHNAKRSLLTQWVFFHETALCASTFHTNVFTVVLLCGRRISRKPKATVFWCTDVATFTAVNFCTEEFSQQNTFTPKNFYNKILLHQALLTTSALDSCDTKQAALLIFLAEKSTMYVDYCYSKRLQTPFYTRHL